MGHVIEHIALEIQTLAGMDTGFGRTRTTEGEKEGVYYVVFSYMEEDAGVYAAKASVRIAQALIDGTDYDLDRRYSEHAGDKGRYKTGTFYRLYC